MTFYGKCGLLVAVTVLLSSQAMTQEAPATDKTGQIPIGNFMRSSEFTQVQISPDGKYFSAILPMPHKPHENILAILDGKTAKIVRAIPSSADELIGNYFWASNDRLVGTVAVKRGGLDTPSATGELYAVNADGSGGTPLFGQRGTSSEDSRTKAHVQQRAAAAYLISEDPVAENQVLIQTYDFSDDRNGVYPSIEKLNVLNGQTTRIGVAPARNAILVADHAGQVRAAYTNDGYTEKRLWTRAGNGQPWTLINDSSKSQLEIAPIGFDRSNNRLYVQTSDADHPDAIELMDPASGQRTRIYQGSFADPLKLLPTADHQDYYAIVTADGKHGLHFIDENSREAKLTQALAANFPDQLAVFSSFSRDGKHAIVFVSSDRNPGDYYLFDLNTHNAQYLMSAKKWIDPQQMRPMQPVSLNARDGQALHGFLTLPAGSKPYPLVVLPHGGPHGIADAWQYDPEVQLLANHGYAVLQVNYRGSGGYGRNFQQRGYRQWGLSMQDDLTDATGWAVQQGYADTHHLCIYGASYGGYAALEGAVREPDLYKCAVGYAGVYDLRVQLDKSDTQRSNEGVDFLHRALGDDRSDLLKRSPLGGVERIKANILLAHGGEDPRVPFKNFREFTAALDQHGKHYETLVEPQEGHGFYLEAHRVEFYQKLLDFLNQNIGTTDASASTTAH